LKCRRSYIPKPGDEITKPAESDLVGLEYYLEGNSGIKQLLRLSPGNENRSGNKSVYSNPWELPIESEPFSLNGIGKFPFWRMLASSMLEVRAKASPETEDSVIHMS